MKIEEILDLATKKNASDIHIIPGSSIMFRIDGEMIPQTKEILKADAIAEIFYPVITEEQRDQLEKNGELDFAFTLPGFTRVRANVYRQRGTYALALRILSVDIPTPEQLEIPKEVVKLTEARRGLVLVTGTAGCGKSTTLASLVDVIAKRDAKNIITIEDPIEYLHAHSKSVVSQREIGCDASSYFQALKSALRQDPDVIVVSELADADSIAVAITAAETGHLVLAALHTTKVTDTIRRIIDIFPVHVQTQIRVQLAEVLQGIVCQQLIPKVDGNGRTAVFEVLLANDTVRNMIRDGKVAQIPNEMENNQLSGMHTMDDAVLSAYMKSRISAEAAVTYARSPEEMKHKIRIY